MRDPTKLREMLAYSTFYDFGVDAPRTSPARLYLNGDFMGLFIAVEDVDDRYAAAHYTAAPDGNLFKEAWPNPEALQRWGEDGFADYASGLQEVGDDPADFVGLAQAVKSATTADFPEVMAPWLDLEGLLRYMAVDRAIKNWDGVTAVYTCTDPGCFPVGPHNYYWYHDSAEGGRFHLVPWDMDNTFQYNDPYIDPRGFGAERPIPNWNVKPADCSPIRVWDSSWVVPSGCDRFLNLLAATQWDGFEALGRELVDGPLRTGVLRQKALAWASLIEPIVQEDPTIDQAQWRHERDLLLNDILVRAPREFGAFLDQGYVEE
jgi:hypothetical protein